MNQITEFSTFGSCTSRNIFNSTINKGYKKYFKINDSVEAQTIISLMSKPVKYDEKLINSDIKYDNECVNNDLSKSFIDFIKKDYVDYIILDTNFDVISQVLVLGKDRYISHSNRLKRTDFYELVKDYDIINIYNNFDEYYEIWKKACDNFFKLIENNCNRTKIILNCSRPCFKYINKDYEISYSTKFEITHNKSLPFRNLLDKYIMKNYDVEVLPFNPKTLADANHIFGLLPGHYQTSYYQEKTQQLLSIIDRNSKLGFENKMNRKQRQKEKYELIEQWDFKKISFENHFYKEKSFRETIKENLNKYNTARIDIKNKNIDLKDSNIDENSINDVKLSNISDFDLEYWHPKWFQKPNGRGIVIQSHSNSLKFDIQCIGDGELSISLKTPDIRLKKKKIPIYLQYTKFLINDEDMLNKTRIVNHNKSVRHKMKVKNGEKISVYVEWMPY